MRLKHFLSQLASLFVITVAILAAVPASAQREEVFDRPSLRDRGALLPAQAATLQARRELIVSEGARSLANEWVGTYVAEDGLTSSAQLDWAPANGFVLWWNTCSPEWRDRVNFGRVDFRDGVVRLTSELGREGEKIYDLSSELITVKWGEQHYLVPLDRLIAFCYAARNAGRSLEINQFFLKRSDREKRRFGLPAVPLHYQKYLVGAPIEATIVEVKSQPRSGFTLNAGRRAGVVPGMKFFVLSPRSVYMLVEVTTVRDNNSEAYVMTSGFKNHSGREVTPRVGWKLTSRAPNGAYQYYPG